jgi:hypothetical protein
VSLRRLRPAGNSAIGSTPPARVLTAASSAAGSPLTPSASASASGAESRGSLAHHASVTAGAPAPVGSAPAGSGGGAASAGGAGGGSGSAPAVDLILGFVLLAALVGRRLLPGDCVLPAAPVLLLSSRPD